MACFRACSCRLALSEYSGLHKQQRGRFLVFLFVALMVDVTWRGMAVVIAG
jgi:hypothetical protein